MASREPTDPPSPWRNSHAKQLLKKDIVAGCVTSSMPAEEVYAMRPKWYKGYKFQNFKTNLENLHKRMSKDQNRASEDLAACLHEMQIPRPQAAAVAAAAYPRWQDSEAEQLLKNDIEAGIGTLIKPEQLWNSREEYQAFPLTVFRKHIQQELCAELATGYWLNKKKEKEKEKKKQQQKKMQKGMNKSSDK
jgi:hypothetical protein